MKKKERKKPLAFINHFYDKPKNRHTDGHGDSMTNPAQRVESVKSRFFGWMIYGFRVVVKCYGYPILSK